MTTTIRYVSTTHRTDYESECREADTQARCTCGEEFTIPKAEFPFKDESYKCPACDEESFVWEDITEWSDTRV